MRSFLLVLSAVTLLTLLSGCGSSSARPAEPSPTPRNSASSQAPDNSISNANGVRPGTSENGAARLVISNSGPPPTKSDVPASDGLRSRSRERINADPSATPPPPTFQAAPENSQFATQMVDGGAVVETRVFNSHPQISRVEIKWADPENRSLKVMLKNGKIVERQAIRISNLRTIPSSEILNIIGIRPARK